MTASERLGQFWASRQQTTDDVERRYNVRAVQPPPRTRTPLTANQHILHLLLTIATGGLWGVVWIVRATQGNRVKRR